jgi:glycosyltransferase involved in cell wall biosynthesis
MWVNNALLAREASGMEPKSIVQAMTSDEGRVSRNPRSLKDTERRVSGSAPQIEVSLLTGGFDKPYAFGLAMTLASRGVCLDFIGSNEVDSPELHRAPNLNFLNLRGEQRRGVGLREKVSRILLYYARLLRYALIAKPKVFHILWHNKFQLLDRTLLVFWYRVLGKRIVLTAHNVNAGKRDSNDSFLNRLTLKIQYRLADHIFVHTDAMKSELLKDFGVREGAVTVIPFGINNSVPDTDMTSAEAKQRLGIGIGEKTILFFGSIRPYKGLEYLVEAFQRIAAAHPEYRLIIAGETKNGCDDYLTRIQDTIRQDAHGGRIIQKIQYIPDEETELYFKAADVLVLPYTHVFQSGVLFLGYRFGLPVIAADVGSLREDIIEGKTGFLCKPGDSFDLAKSIETYFDSDLYGTLEDARPGIRDYASQRHSWEVVGQMTRNVYARLLGQAAGNALIH